MARKSDYTDAIADVICERLAEGTPLVTMCKETGMPGYSTVLRWRSERDEFRDRYARAREDAADTLADKIQGMAERVEDGTLDPQAGRVAIDALKWIASKLKPSRYGDRQTIEHQGDTKFRAVDHCPEWLQQAIAEGHASAVQQEDEEPTTH